MLPLSTVHLGLYLLLVVTSCNKPTTDKSASGSGSAQTAGSGVASRSARSTGSGVATGSGSATTGSAVPRPPTADDGFTAAFPAEPMALGKATPAELADYNARRSAEARKQGSEQPLPIVGMVQYLDHSQMDTAKQRGISYQVVVFDFGPAADANKLLESGVKALLAPMTSTKTKEIVHAGMKGVAGSFIDPRTPATHAEFQMFVHGGKQYTLSAFETGGADADHVARKAFFDSFAVVKQ